MSLAIAVADAAWPRPILGFGPAAQTDQGRQGVKVPEQAFPAML